MIKHVIIFLNIHNKNTLHCRRLIRKTFFLVVRPVPSIQVIKDIFKRVELKNNILLHVYEQTIPIFLYEITTSNIEFIGHLG